MKEPKEEHSEDLSSFLLIRPGGSQARSQREVGREEIPGECKRKRPGNFWSPTGCQPRLPMMHLGVFCPS